MKGIHYLDVAPDLKFPVDAGTQTFAFIGRKGSGKTYGTGKIVELMIGAGIQVAILDTVGNWYGLRLAADGKGEGLDVPIVGGLRGDVPLEASGGALIADVLVETGRSMVIDVSQFSKADRQRFATAFGQRLWRLKKAEKQPSPLHLILEESQLIVPENVRGDSAAMVGIYEEIIRLGRNYGIGVSMITQRPQSVNKEVLNQTECLMVFQVNGAHERKALREWIVHQGMATNLLDELPSLKPGECYVWSPQWLGILQKIKINPKRTFDSTSTPKAGVKSARARDLKPLNMDDLKEKMQGTIDRAKEDDPRELKLKIASLTKELQNKPVAPPKIKEVPLLKELDLKRLDTLADRLLEKLDRHSKIVDELSDKNESLYISLQTIKAILKPSATPPALPPRTSVPASPINVAKAMVATHHPDKLPGGERKILIVLAQYPQGRNKSQIGIMAGYSHNGGAFNNYLGALRSKGYIDGREPIMITELGLATLGLYNPLPTGEALYQYWLGQLGKCEREILTALYTVGAEMSKEAIAANTITGYEPNGGGFNNAMGKLRTLELIEKKGDSFKVSDVFQE